MVDERQAEVVDNVKDYTFEGDSADEEVVSNDEQMENNDSNSEGDQKHARQGNATIDENQVIVSAADAFDDVSDDLSVSFDEHDDELQLKFAPPETSSPQIAKVVGVLLDPVTGEVGEAVSFESGENDVQFSDGPNSSDYPILRNLFNEGDLTASLDKRDRDTSESEEDGGNQKQLKLSYSAVLSEQNSPHGPGGEDPTSGHAAGHMIEGHVGVIDQGVREGGLDGNPALDEEGEVEGGHGGDLSLDKGGGLGGESASE